MTRLYARIDRSLTLTAPQTVMYHDGSARNVWRSNDEGKSWEMVADIPAGEAWSLVEHPFDRNVAFVLGKSTTHYRTINRGTSWQSFTVAAPPAVGAPALAFHARKWDWILYMGTLCDGDGKGWGSSCYDLVRCDDVLARLTRQTYVTRDAFGSSPTKMVENSSQCIWAHGAKNFAPSVADELIYCMAFEAPTDATAGAPIGERPRGLRDSRLYSSRDFFAKERQLVDFGIGRDARGLVGMGAVNKYLFVALKPVIGDDASGAGAEEMLLYVTTNAAEWGRAVFPHGHGLRENAYTIVDSTGHSLIVDVLGDATAGTGTLFTSDSTGTQFTRSLEHTNRNVLGIVDFEALENIEGVAIANVVANADEVEGRKEDKRVQTRITFDDGSHWSPLRAPATDHEGKKVKCDVSDSASCSLHLHSVSHPHNLGRVFSSTAPGLVMAVGSIGDHLLAYDECDTFVSTDAGLTWSMAHDGAHKYEFGDAGSILVMVDDEDATDEIRYSFDFGKSWCVRRCRWPSSRAAGRSTTLAPRCGSSS